MRFRLLGDWWRLVWASPVVHPDGEEVRGQCDNGTRVIEVDRAMGEQEALEVLLHELMHATNWVAGEKVVTEAARDMARLIYRNGWRRSA